MAGPGSFTGLRIGVVSAKALAYAWNVPLIGVDGLEALAWQAAAQGRILCPLVDARRQHVYGALFRGRSDGPPVRLSPTRHQPLGELLAAALEAGEGPIACLGDGLLIHRERVAATIGERLDWLAPGETLLHPLSVAALGRARLEQGERADWLTLVPQYSKESEAEAKWRTSSES